MFIWYVPKGDEYSSKYIEEMRKAQKDTEEQYKNIWHRRKKKRKKECERRMSHIRE